MFEQEGPLGQHFPSYRFSGSIMEIFLPRFSFFLPSLKDIFIE